MLRWYQDNGENKHATARNFGIDRKRLREWLEKEDRLRDNRVGAAKKKRKLNAGKEPLSLELDKAVLRFLEEERVAASPIVYVAAYALCRTNFFTLRMRKGGGIAVFLLCNTVYSLPAPLNFRLSITLGGAL